VEAINMLNIGLLILRLAVGLTLAAHGAQKAMGWFGGPGPKGVRAMVEAMGFKPVPLWAVALTTAELGGGLCLALGLLTPIAALVVTAAMVTAIFTVHVDKGFFNSQGGYEFPLLIVGACVSLALIGPGSFSLDRLLNIQLPEPTTVVVSAILAAIGVFTGLQSRHVGGGKRGPAGQTA
jgi:putative oxidoreductase